MFKVIPNNPEESPKPIPVAKFPKLMQHRSEHNLIYLFLEESKSIIIKSNLKYYMEGEIDSYSRSEFFKDYNLPITIQNILE